MEFLKKTHKVYLVEKYNSIVKELDNIHSILLYYKQKTGGENTHNTVLDDLISDVSNIKAQIKIYIGHEKYGVKTIKDKNDLEFLMYLDVQYEKIADLLHYIKKVHHKTLQYISENFVQMPPMPSLLKRYSSKSISSLIDKHTEKLSKVFSDKDQEPNFISLWSHQDTFRITEAIGSNTSVFGNHSFYYHDLIWALPVVIDHEVLLQSIDKNKIIKDDIDKMADRIADELKGFINGQEELKNFYLQFEYLYTKENVVSFLSELVAGYIAFLLYGNSYRYAFYHELLFAHFGRDFWHDGINDLVRDFPIVGNEKRDFVLIRSFLISKWTNTATPQYTQVAYQQDNYIKDIISLLNSFIEIKNTKALELDSNNYKDEIIKSFQNDSNIVLKAFGNAMDGQDDEKFNTLYGRAITFAKFVELIDKFCEVSIEQIGDTFRSRLDNNSYIRKIREELAKNSAFFLKGQDVTPISHILWKERFEKLHEDKLPHRSLLRKTILDRRDYSPYVMEEIAYSARSIDKSKDIVLGYFDEISFQEKENVIPINDLEKDIDNYLDKAGDDAICVKHALLKIDNDIKYKEFGQGSATLRAIIKVFFRNDIDLTYIQKLYNDLKGVQGITHGAFITCYKSLGPEDIVCVIEVEKQDSVWEWIEYIERLDYVYDTHMALQLIHKDSELGWILDDGIWVKQLYRLNRPMTYNEFQDNLSKIDRNAQYIKEKKLQIFNIEGTYDYELWWTQVSYSKVVQTYNEMLENIDTVQSFLVSGGDTF